MTTSKSIRVIIGPEFFAMPGNKQFLDCKGMTTTREKRRCCLPNGNIVPGLVVFFPGKQPQEAVVPEDLVRFIN